jgi:hypothetical protein
VSESARFEAYAERLDKLLNELMATSRCYEVRNESVGSLMWIWYWQRDRDVQLLEDRLRLLETEHEQVRTEYYDTATRLSAIESHPIYGPVVKIGRWASLRFRCWFERWFLSIPV